jgi:cytochrome c-type biogenesis protein CcmH/NrfF
MFGRCFIIERGRMTVDPVIIILIGIVIFAIFRLRSMFRRVKKLDRSDEIQSRLAKLRKKRDEDAK